MSEEHARTMAEGLFNSLPGQQQEKSMGALEAAALGVGIGVAAFAKGAADFIYSDEMKELAAHGGHEITAGLFTGNAYVMYPRGQHDDHGMEEHGVHGKNEPAQEQPGMDGQQQEQHHGRGR